MSLVSLLKGKGPSGFGYGSTAEEVTHGLDLAGRHVLVTGCNSGIGHETMRVLALRGASVVGAARSLDKARQACAAVQGDTTGLACELSDPASVRACVAALVQKGRQLDAIIANAGIMALPRPERVLGYEKQFFTNHVGHFMLVTGLLDLLAPSGRVVVLSSAAHRQARGIAFDDLAAEKSYTPWVAYGQSKLANLLFARELARRFGEGGRVANAVHPGVIATNLGRHMGRAMNLGWAAMKPIFLKTVPQGAATQVWAAVHPDAARINGEYLSDCNVARSTAVGQDLALAARLWTETERIVAGLGAGPA